MTGNVGEPYIYGRDRQSWVLGTNEQMMSRLLGSKEFAVLTALNTGPSYGEEIRRSLGLTYVLGKELDRMEHKGLVTSQWSDPLPQAGGRSRRIYCITKAGRTALRETWTFYSRRVI